MHPCRSRPVANPYISGVGHFSLPVYFVARPSCKSDSCCPVSHSPSAILNKCLAILSTSATFTATAFPSHSPHHFSVHISYVITRFPAPSPTSPPRSPYAFLTVLCQYWHICCLDTEFECLPLLRLPFWRYLWNRLILFSPKSPKALQSDAFANNVLINLANNFVISL
jgi:hypothetical protein